MIGGRRATSEREKKKGRGEKEDKKIQEDEKNLVSRT